MLQCKYTQFNLSSTEAIKFFQFIIQNRISICTMKSENKRIYKIVKKTYHLKIF